MKAKRRNTPHPKPVDALVYPRFSGVPTFMRLPYVPQADELDIALIGIPFDGGTTYWPGPRFGSDGVGRSMEKAPATWPESMGSSSLLPNRSTVMDWARFSGI